MFIRAAILPVGHKLRPGTKTTMKYITIHNTGNPTSVADGERRWLDNPTNTRKASWHYVLDEKEVVQAIPEDEIAWHAGTAEGNRTSIGIEICESGDQKKVWDNAIKFVAGLLKKRGWGIDRLRTHKDWSGKNCPRLILPKWNQFKADVQKELDKLNNPSVGKITPPSKLEVDKVKFRLNGKNIDISGILIDGRNYVQARELLEALGFKVEWEATTSTVVVNKV